MEKTKDKKLSLREQVFQSVINDIIAGLYAQGEIITENDLTKKFNISKSPVRDALRELCNDGILTSIPRVGYRITYYTDEWINAIKNFRLCIEPYYLEQNFDMLTDDAIKKVEKTQIESQDHFFISNVSDHWIRNQKFHLSIAEIWKDQFFYEKLQSTLHKQTIAYSQKYWNQWQHSEFPLDVEKHLKIIKALKNREKIKAKQLLIDDISSFPE